MPKAVIFDLDGTLADTIQDIASAINGALARRGFPTHGIPALKRMVGNGFRHLVTTALPPELRQEAFIEEIRAEASEFYGSHALVATRPYPGVEGLLSSLSARRIGRSILSNKPDELVRRVVEGLFPGGGFVVVRGEVPAFPRKPDPGSALDIASLMALPPAEICYVGDSDVDMRTAHNAGMMAIGAGWGFRGRRELEEAGADAVIEAPADLLAYF